MFLSNWVHSQGFGLLLQTHYRNALSNLGRYRQPQLFRQQLPDFAQNELPNLGHNLRCNLSRYEQPQPNKCLKRSNCFLFPLFAFYLPQPAAEVNISLLSLVQNHLARIQFQINLPS